MPYRILAATLGLAGLALSACGSSPVTSPPARPAASSATSAGSAAPAGPGTGSASAATASGSAAHACKLVSPPDAARVMGSPLTGLPQEIDGATAYSACHYLTVAGGGNEDLTITIGAGQQSQFAEATFGIYETAGTVVKKVPGLGTSAQEYDTPAGNSACVLSVTKGTVTMVLTIVPSMTGCLQKVQQAATIALGNAGA